MRKVIGPVVKGPGRAYSEVRRRPQVSSREIDSIESRGSHTPQKQRPQQPNIGPLYQKFQPTPNIAEIKPIIDKTAQFVPVKRFHKNGIWQKDHPTRPGAVIYESSLESRDFAENLAQDRKIALEEKNGRILWNQLPSLTESKAKQKIEDSQAEYEQNTSKDKSFFVTGDDPDTNKSFQNGRKKSEPEQHDYDFSEEQPKKENLQKSTSNANKNKENDYEYQDEGFEQFTDEGGNRTSCEKPRPPDKKPSDRQFRTSTPRRKLSQTNQKPVDLNESSSTVEGRTPANKVLDKSESISENQRYNKVIISNSWQLLMDKQGCSDESSEVFAGDCVAYLP